MLKEVSSIFNIIESYSKLTKAQKKVGLLLIVFVILMVSTSILRIINKNNKTTWKYGSFTSASDILYKAEIIDNRRIYWSIKEIINNFLSTMQDAEFDDTASIDKKTVSDYYSVLSDEYKRTMSNEEFEEKAKNFILSFLLEDHLGNKYVDEFIIKNVYLFDNNKYLCELSLKDSDDTVGYFGVELDENKAKFSIFYIE